MTRCNRASLATHYRPESIGDRIDNRQRDHREYSGKRNRET
jgi:hypothetical protein